MNNKTIGIIAGAVVLIIAGFFMFNQQKQSAVLETGSVPPTEAPAVIPPPTTNFTLAQVATHNNALSCWSAVNGNVYDLSAWIRQHPGGQEAILSICGQDGSAAFNGQHDGAKKQADILATFKIGALIQ